MIRDFSKTNNVIRRNISSHSFQRVLKLFNELFLVNLIILGRLCFRGIFKTTYQNTKIFNYNHFCFEKFKSYNKHVT